VADKTVSDAIVERLQEWGVEQVFGYPGDGINGILGALQRAGDKPRFIQARHEEMAAFEAVGYAKFTGRPGVCMATSGPGAIHLLNGLYDAKLDHVPVVAIFGQQALTALGSHYQQEVDLKSLFKDVCAEFVEQASTPQQFPALIDRAFRTALGLRGPTAVIVPNDLQEQTYSPPQHAFKQTPSSLDWSPPNVVPHEDDLRRAADVLNAGERVAILVGQGARSARHEVLAVADLLGAGVSKALLGKDVLPDDDPIVCGSIGLLGTKPSWELMMSCDTFLMVGSAFPYVQFLPPFGQARGVQIDIDPRMIGLRYPTEVNLVGDSRETLKRLIPLLQRKDKRDWQEKIKAEIRDWWNLIEDRSKIDANPVNPQLVVRELSKRIPEDAIVSADSGSIANWYARDLVMRGSMRGSLSGTLATMGAAVPYAVGAKFGHPDRPVFALVGDGAMQMNNMAELLTVAKYWKDWADPRWVCLVLNNSDLNQVTWEQRAMAGDPKFEASQVLPKFDYAGFARMAGLEGIRVDDPKALGAGWDAALSADRPVVLDVVTDPEFPPLPPHVQLKEALALTRAMLKGDPATPQIIEHGMKGKLLEFLPGH
jgi:pyruvate dehydrogenase (quinone)